MLVEDTCCNISRYVFGAYHQRVGVVKQKRRWFTLSNEIRLLFAGEKKRHELPHRSVLDGVLVEPVQFAGARKEGSPISDRVVAGEHQGIDDCVFEVSIEQLVSKEVALDE